MFTGAAFTRLIRFCCCKIAERILEAGPASVKDALLEQPHFPGMLAETLIEPRHFVHFSITDEQQQTLLKTFVMCVEETDLFCHYTPFQLSYLDNIFVKGRDFGFFDCIVKCGAQRQQWEHSPLRVAWISACVRFINRIPQ